MPVLGWLAGASIAHLISSIDHWIALILLSWVGLRMVREGFSADSETHEKDPSRGRTLVMLSIATSIDAFAVGLSLAMLQVSIAYPAVIIGVITAGLSLLGILLGRKLGEAFGKRMEIVGGMILVAIGLRILMSHLTAA